MESRPLVKTKEPGIYRRGNRYVVVYRDAFGKQCKKAAGSTLKEAKDEKARLRANPEEATAASRERFGPYARREIESFPGRTNKGITEETRNDYRARLEQDAIPFLGHLQLGHIRQSHLDALAERVNSRGVSPNTVRLALAPVKALLAQAVAKGDLRVNPAAGWRCRYTQVVEEYDEAGNAIEEQVKALTADELAALIGEVSKEWRLFYSFLSQTGLRISEAIELRWKDVNLASRTFKVQRRFYRGKVGRPKSKYGRRTVKLTQELSDALMGLANGDPDGLVFTTATGQRVDQSNLMSRVLKPAAVRAGLGTWLITPKGKRAETWVGHHTFRHTNATLLFRHGWNAKQVQVWLGHHSPAFTLSTYVHLLADDLPELPAEWGNKGATQHAETGRNDAVDNTVDSAQLLGLARAV
jgi:integrase